MSRSRAALAALAAAFALLAPAGLSRTGARAAEAPPARGPAVEGLCRTAPPILVDEPRAPSLAQAGQLIIQPTWDPTIAAHPGWQTVIQFAMNEWMDTLLDFGCSRNPLPIYVRAVPLGGFLGFTQALVYASGECMYADTIGIDPSFTWFVDPTPWDDAEYTTGPVPAGYDLLSVVRHELGHAVGWNFGIPTNNLMSGSDFDPARLNIRIGGGTGMHADSSWAHDDLMNPALPDSTRRRIALYPDAAMIVRAYGGAIPMAFVDPTVTGPGIGWATNPYKQLSLADALAPAGWPLLLSSGDTNHVPALFQSSTARRWQAARGGATIVAP